MRHEERLEQYRKSVDEALELYLPSDEFLPQKRLVEAMRYSLFAGGKRIRPVFLLEFCRVCGGDPEIAMPFACAVEMIHTYSLIHDDLPCMDDDTLRRGRNCCHVEYGEATALLAGDALQTAAFEIMLDAVLTGGGDMANAARAAGIIAMNAGVYGMAGGQQLDIDGSVEFQNPFETVMATHALKTGALIAAAAEVGCILADASEDRRASAVSFAKALGMAFQIRDDILDFEGDAALLGKEVGSDARGGKLTFATVKPIQECKSLVISATQDAIGYLAAFDAEGGEEGRETDFLVWLANDMMNRRS